MANKRHRMFKIEKPQISDDYIKNFEDFFVVIDTGMQNSFILLDKNDYLFLQNANGDTNICSKMILRYSIFPAIDEEVTSTAIIENKLFVSETLRIPLLEKEDIKSIIENRLTINYNKFIRRHFMNIRHNWKNKTIIAFIVCIF